MGQFGQMISRKASTAGGTGETSLRASILATTILTLLFCASVTDILCLHGRISAAVVLQACYTMALFVAPVLCLFRGPRRLLVRYRWPVLAIQAVLTWVPFAVFGGQWQVGAGGLLAGLVLLTVRGWASWFSVGALLAADVTLRVGVIGLPSAPVWSGALWAVLTFVADAAVLFGMIRLTQLVGELHEAHSRAAWLAVAAVRLRAADELRSALGESLASIAAAAAAAWQALARDPGGARVQITAAGAAAREAIARARVLTADRRCLPQPDSAAAPPGSTTPSRTASAPG
jgi:two-component system, NarL family, sensor histidine kinase DesK